MRGEQLSARPFTLKGDVFLAYEAVWEAQAALERDDLEAALPAAMAAIELQGIAHSAQYVQPDAARAKAADWQRRIASSKGGSVWKEREEARVESLVLEASHRLREMRKRRTPRRGDRHEVAAWLAKHGKYTYGKSENRIYKLIGPAFKRPG